MLKTWPETGRARRGLLLLSSLSSSHFFPCIISFLPLRYLISVLPFYHLFFLFCYIIPFPLYLIGNHLCFESCLLNSICATFVCSWLFLIEMLEPELKVPKFFFSAKTLCLIFSLFFFSSFFWKWQGGFPRVHVCLTSSPVTS